MFGQCLVACHSVRAARNFDDDAESCVEHELANDTAGILLASTSIASTSIILFIGLLSMRLLSRIWHHLGPHI